MTTYAAFLQVFTIVSDHVLEMDVWYLFALAESEHGVAYLLNRLFYNQNFDKIKACWTLSMNYGRYKTNTANPRSLSPKGTLSLASFRYWITKKST